MHAYIYVHLIYQLYYCFINEVEINSADNNSWRNFSNERNLNIHRTASDVNGHRNIHIEYQSKIHHGVCIRNVYVTFKANLIIVFKPYHMFVIGSFTECWTIANYGTIYMLMTFILNSLISERVRFYQTLLRLFVSVEFCRFSYSVSSTIIVLFESSI